MNKGQQARKDEIRTMKDPSQKNISTKNSGQLTLIAVHIRAAVG